MPQMNQVVPKLLNSLQEQLELRLVCSKCSLQENESTYRLKEVDHCCAMEILLARSKGKQGNLWRKVARRPGFPKPAQYSICRYYVPGMGCRRHRNDCTFAWSQEEVVVWTFEKNSKMERHILKKLLQQAQTGSVVNGLSRPPQSSISEEIQSEFGGHFQEICKFCFYQSPPRICLKDSVQSCAKHWNALLVHVITNGKMKEQYTEIRPCPKGVKKLCYCVYITAGKPCRHGVNRCNYAHSDVELAVWEAERNFCLVRTDLLTPLADCSPGQEPSQPEMHFYCRVCLVTCNSQESFENHCSSVEHTQMITTDTMTEWAHRAPPYGLRTFALCSRADVCEFGQDCTNAHSTEELEEWIQRAKVIQKNQKHAKQDGLLAYQARLLAEYQESHNEVLIISEQVDGVTVTCQQPLQVQSEEKKLRYRWVFEVVSQNALEHVALLKRLPGATFSLAGPGLSRGLTYASGKRFQIQRTSFLAYQVEVGLECCTFGTYEQWLVFDFGSRPVLVQKLQVQIGKKEAPLHTLLAAEQRNHFVDAERWHSGNRVLVPSVERTSRDVELLAKYKPPSLSLSFQRGAERKPISRFNYREQMHNFLFREEEAQEAEIARFNLQVPVFLQQMVETLSCGMKFAPPGELYAHIPTPYSLTPDSKEGYLLYHSVRTALLALDPPINNRVYEVSVERQFTTEKSIWLLLPKRCCFELGLKTGTSLQMKVQLQIDMLPFRQWHHAADRLLDERLVLPDVAACSIPQSYGLVLQRGNKKQNQAFSFITGYAAGTRQVPPLLIYGPFGTGKTYTLAMATLEIIKQPRTRVLICTHTNSAADIYIREYFHDYVASGHPEAVPLRIKYTERSIKSTDPVTLQYCCLSPNQDSFRLPTKEELEQHRIVIASCMLSQDLGVAPGYFSHILIDEAAQMLECEALVPLCLATPETRIILAGDHMQMTPKLFCLQGGEQSADHTLLNRLFQYYQKEKHEVAVKSRIIFNENYRSTSSIIDFVSRHFYVGKGDAIRAMGNIPPHPEFHPFVFCHVAGPAERDISMTSWYNPSEIMQVVEKVQEMCQKWPDEWGAPELKQICVVTYGAQVATTRQELRKRRLGEVVVENYENMPGKQYRVIIISTVHTRESLGQSSSFNLDVFNDARVLNTIMTRAQSQIIAVGDAVALCSFGQCSKVWKSLIKECIEKNTVTPETLTMEEIKQAVSDRTSWSRGSPESDDEGSDTESWFSDAESLNVDDPILQELLDESKDVVVTVSAEGLLNVTTEASVPQSSRDEYVNFSAQIMNQMISTRPNVYKRCEFTKEGFDRASAFTLDDIPPLNIQIRGRVHCGMAFTGDQVLVEILQTKTTPDAGLYGKVVGVMKKSERNLKFICTVDEFDLRVMIPVDRTVTKIFVPGLKGEPDVIPIRSLEKGGKIKLKTRKKITQDGRKKCLFAVQIVNWREGFYYPLGIVTELLSVPSTLEEGLGILNIEYSLTRQYPAPVNNEVDRIASGKFGLEKGSRKDCRAYPTFTVDPPGAKDLDDAISVRDLGDEYEIGIHIADVASVISKGCALDTEAKNRGASYYAPGKEPVCMLPPSLSQDLLSLLPQKDRDVISLFILVDKKTDQVVKGFFTVSTICSDRQLTYEEAEDIIKEYHMSLQPVLRFDTLEDCVAVALHFSRVHRMFRLQDDCYYDQLDKGIPLGQRYSHQMVQEFMIMFNSFVGEFLINNNPTRNLTPLRCQVEPNPQLLSKMCDKYRDLIPLSTHLSHHLKAQTPIVHTQTNGKFVLLTALWDHLKSATSACDFPKMLDIITTDDIHPKLSPVNLEFRKLLGRSYFLRSNSSVQSKAGHYSLHVDSYTWASSPIRRYMDIVVQRQIISVLLKKPVLDSPTDIEVLCHDFNRKNGLAAAYEKKAYSLQVALQLKCQVQQKVAFVMNVEAMAKNFKALFPLDKESIPDPLVIPYRALQLVAQPSLMERENAVRLFWRRRIYSIVNGKDCTPKKSVLWDKTVALFNHKAWCDVLAAIRNKEFEKIMPLLEKGRSHQPRSVGSIRRSSHYMELSLELNAGDVLHLQLTSDVQRGFPTPYVQLWTVTPGFDVCLEHTDKPIDCFSKYASHASRESYDDASAYRKVWLPLLDMEAVSSAVSENDSIILHDVKIKWEKKRTKKGHLQGTLSFNKDFLKQCAIEVDFSFCYLCIRLPGLKVARDLDSVDALSHSLQNLSLTKGDAKASRPLVDPATYTWVAHGRTEECMDNEKLDQRGENLVHFHLHFMSMQEIPAEVTQEASRFTIELIPELLPDVRQEKAIWRLQNATKLTQSIALGKAIPENAMTSKLLQRRKFDLPRSKRELNPSQNRAILEALKKPFTLIQGPPGTGKTVVGTHIVYWFHQLNQESSKQEQTLDDADVAQKHILYCGPSNKSVDVVAEMLMKMPFLRPLRVYGESIEIMDFPYPGSSLHVSQKFQRDSKSKPEIRDITLHYRMRQPTNPFSKEICAFDARVKNGEEITENEVEQINLDWRAVDIPPLVCREKGKPVFFGLAVSCRTMVESYSAILTTSTQKYKKTLSSARVHELQRHDVILCTCSASCASVLTDKKVLHVKQVLIDECAMSTEPETLIPLVNHSKVEKVVLLGDHKQLRPVVNTDLCRKLGMETSLFERYKQQALMLDIQYRMHKDICQFPSEAFYHRKLKTCPSLSRNPSAFYHKDRDCCPIIFGHIEGREKSLMVSTEDGNENSRANPEEAEQVVRIAKQLTLDRTTRPEQIAVLTPYSAQVVEIKKLLHQQGLQAITVCTIMKSQGSEWKYVIVSTVRSCPRSGIDKRPTKSWQKQHLGFVTDPNQVNVCITRAQEGLCIIGNRYLLESNELWRQLVEHYRKQKCYTFASEIQIRKRLAIRQ